MTILYERLLLHKEDRGLSFYAIEKGVNFSNGTLRKWQTSTPSAENILCVARFLDISVDYLLGNTDNPMSHKNNPQDLAAAAEELAAEAQALRAAAGTVASQIQNNVQSIMDKYHVSPRQDGPEAVTSPAPVQGGNEDET